MARIKFEATDGSDIRLPDRRTRLFLSQFDRGLKSAT
jgi:hypothetical protein